MRMNYKEKSRRWSRRANGEQDSTGLLGHKDFSFSRERDAKLQEGSAQRTGVGYFTMTTAQPMLLEPLGLVVSLLSYSGS